MPEVENTLNILGEIAKANHLVVPQNIAGTDTIIQQDSLLFQQGTTPPKPTAAQIRYWQWLREKKLLVGGSRYIQPKNKVKVVASVGAKNSVLELPARSKNNANTDWLTLLFILVLIIFATVRVAYSKYLGYLFQSLVNYSTSFRLFSEKNYPISHGAFRLNIIFYFTFSLFLYQVFTVFRVKPAHENLTFFVTIMGAVLAFFFLKKTIYYLLGLVFESTFETSEYLFNMDNISRTLGIVLFPVVVLINYYPAKNPVFMVVTGILIVFVFYVFLLQRGIYILLRKQFSIFYLFLYLCTLEILPLLLIYKVVVL